MKPTKTIDVTINGIEASFTIEFKQDENGNEIGVLTAPYGKVISYDEFAVWERVFELSGELLECIERQYFDNYVFEIPVEGYPFPVGIVDLIYKTVPEDICDQIIYGTYKIDGDADSSRYGNMPSETKNKPGKAGERPRVKTLKDPTFDANIDFLKNMFSGSEHEDFINGIFENDSSDDEPKEE